MTALVIPIDRVRRAVDQSVRLGADETQRVVAARIVGDIRDEQSENWQQRYARAMRVIGCTLPPGTEPQHEDAPQ